ncbi:MAG: hypothetical protein ACE5GB_11130 [Acidimicrobiales bacterium]
MIRRGRVVVALAATTVLAAAAPAAAHGVGGRTDLPLPAWQLAWAAGFAVASSFVALGLFWNTPRLRAAAQGTVLPSAVQTVGRVVLPASRLFGLLAFGLVLYAALYGTVNPSVNIAPTAVFITFWVGLQIVSPVLGDVWQGFNPFFTMADAGARVRARIAGIPVAKTDPAAGTHWPAVVAIFSFLWFELAYHSPDDPRAVGAFLLVYTAVMIAGAVLRGRAWVRRADGFGLLFSLLAGLAPLHRDAEGKWRRRSPLAGLAVMAVRPGTVPFILVVLGSTSFDGFSRGSVGRDIGGTRTGWDGSVVATTGLLFMIALVGVLYLGAIRVMSRVTGDDPAELSGAFGVSLVPIAMAYAVAHYFSSLVLEGQRLIIQVSDPLGRSWDLFGTVDYGVDFTWISTGTIAWIQTLAIAGGHVLGVAAAHDRATERYGRGLALRSQYPMLVVMIAYTVAALFLLLGA